MHATRLAGLALTATLAVVGTVLTTPASPSSSAGAAPPVAQTPVEIAAKKTGASLKPGGHGKKGVAPRPIREYVALGDSWSADTMFIDANGLPDATHAPLDCFQSPVNYPKLLAQELKVERFADATCGSATTVHFSAPQKLPLGGTNPPQFDRLTARTDLVTMGIGGNDAGIAAAAFDCLSVLPFNVPGIEALPTLPDLPVPLLGQKLPLGGCKAFFTQGGTDTLKVAIDASLPKVVKAIKEVRKRSPHARILLVNYLNAVPAKGCWPLVPITDPDMGYLHQSFLHLNTMLDRAARRTGTEVADTFAPTVGHDVCAAPNKRYAEALGVTFNDIGIVVPAHPNAAGARAQFRAVLAQVKKGR
ncbi:SGNH/GDSL hydrolase family protein [Nocardioides alcanivorans]|uniref:SGNH/GDSL hydrolase family protein n=1 Tax=Nocardioides alcanivorans TaxID=2897352 RepID=UPI001F3893BF|nr:SGNH/GDSL hydrolase family protein [Nocardioides alcanivorans]